MPFRFVPVEERDITVQYSIRDKDKVVKVTYYNRSLPHERYVQAHLAAYPGVRFKIVLPREDLAGGVIAYTDYCYDGQGLLLHSCRTRIDDGSGRYLDKVTRDALGNIKWIEDYEYNESGELQIVRTRDTKGRVICEDWVAD